MIQRCCRSYLFRRRLHPHPEGNLHSYAQERLQCITDLATQRDTMYSFQIKSLEHRIHHHLPWMISNERKRIESSLWKDIWTIERSIESTMDCSYLPTTNRDLSIKAHLEEGRRMENKFQQLLHLMRYESKFPL